jgi:hypothetical protein
MAEHTSPDSAADTGADDRAYRYTTYVPLVGSSFEIVAADSESFTFELVSATEVARGGECFALVFSTPDVVPFVQDTCRVRHPELGEYLLFLVPIAPGAQSGTKLEAVFNRLEV